jgi:hypothetical protein
MEKKYKYLTLSVLFGIVLLLAVGLPLLLSNDSQAQPAAAEIKRDPTSTPRPAVSEIKEVFVREEEEAPERNCTYPLHYWIEMPEKWPNEIVLSKQVYTREIMHELYMEVEPDLHTRLIQQMYTSFLNVLYGADMISIEEILFNAAEWLEDNPPGRELSEFNLRQGREMAQILEHFNNGEIGPGACPDAPMAPTATLTPTETATPSPTDPPPTAVPQVQVVPQQPAAPAPTNPPPPPPPAPAEPAPTETPLPTPTQPLPTEPPLPTDTPLPPPTSTPAPSPTPVPEEPDKSHPQGVALSEKYNVSYQEIMDWNNQGFGFGDIDKAYDLSKQTGTSVSTIFEMFSSGMGWGEIRDALNP